MVRAVLFDAYGTLFDVYSVGLLAEQLFPQRGEALALLWRDKQIEYTRLITMSAADGSRYRPFWEVTRAGLRHAARQGAGRCTASGSAGSLQARWTCTFLPAKAGTRTMISSLGSPSPSGLSRSLAAKTADTW